MTGDLPSFGPQTFQGPHIGAPGFLCLRDNTRLIIPDLRRTRKPVPTEGKGYPFEVEIPPGLAVEGFILTDQIRALDWRTRRVQVADRAPEELLQRVRVMVRSFFA